jgi:hypothetical protein
MNLSHCGISQSLSVAMGQELPRLCEAAVAGLAPIATAPAHRGKAGWPDGLSVTDEASSACLLFYEDSESPRAVRHSDEAPILDQLACHAF